MRTQNVITEARAGSHGGYKPTCMEKSRMKGSAQDSLTPSEAGGSRWAAGVGSPPNEPAQRRSSSYLIKCLSAGSTETATRTGMSPLS